MAAKARIKTADGYIFLTDSPMVLFAGVLSGCLKLADADMRLHEKVGTVLSLISLSRRLVTGVFPRMVGDLIGIQINQNLNAIAQPEKGKNDAWATRPDRAVEVLRSATKKLECSSNILDRAFHDLTYFPLSITANFILNAKFYAGDRWFPIKVCNSLVTLVAFVNIIYFSKEEGFKLWVCLPL